jgi:hypothetical protein
MTRRIPKGFSRDAALCLGVALAYFGGAELGLQFSIASANISPIWPPSGIAMAAILLFGYRVVPGIILGSLCFNLSLDPYNPASFVSVAGETLQAVTAAWLVTRFGGGADSFNRVRDASVFVILGGLVATTVSCTIGAPAYAAAGSYSLAELPRIWAVWWLGDAAGVISFGALLLLWARIPRIEWRPSQVGEAVIFLVTLAPVVYVVFFDLFGPAAQHMNPQALMLPFVLWAAIRFGPRECISVICLIALIAIVATSDLHGPFAHGEAMAGLIAVQLYISIHAATTLVVGAAWQERSGVQKALEAAEAQYRDLYENAPDMYFSDDARTGIIVGCNQTLARVLGYSKEEITGQPIAFLYHEESIEHLNKSFDKFLQTGESIEGRRVLRRRDGGRVVTDLKARAVRDASGNVVESRASLRDVTREFEAEEARREAEQQYKELYDSAPDMLFSDDMESGKILNCNETLAKALGYTKAEIIGQPIEFLYDARSHEEFRAGRKEFDETGRLIGHRRLLRRRDGGIIVAELKANAIRDDGGKVIAVRASLRDMTQQHEAEEVRRKAEEAVRQSEARLAEAQALAHIGSWEFDPRTGKFEYSNEMFAMSRTSREEFDGTIAAAFESVLPDDRPKAQEAFARALRDGGAYEIEYGFRTRDGHIRHARERGRFIRENGISIRGIGTIQDISEQHEAEEARREAEEAVRRNEAHLAAAQQVARIGSWDLDLRTGRIEWSDEMHAICGIPREGFDGDHAAWSEPVHPDDQPIIDGAFSRAVRDGTAYEVEVRLLMRDGGIKYIRERGRVFQENGEPVRAIGAVQDITEQREAMDLLTRLGRIIEDSSNEIYVFDATSLCFTMVNRGARDNLGYSIEELRTKTPLDLKPNFTLETFETLIQPLRDGNRKYIEFETVHRRKDGSAYDVAVRLQLTHTDLRPSFLAIIEDMTAWKRAEERFKTIFDAAPSGMIMADGQGRIILANRQMAHLFGYEIGELPGKSISDLVPHRLRASHESHLAAYSASPRTMVVGNGGVKGRRKDGSEIVVEIGLNPMPSGYDNHVLASIIDVTARRQSEELIRRSLREKEVLLQEVHHRVKNNLQVVSSMLRLQSQGLTDPHIVAAIRDSETRVRAMAIIHELLHQSDKLDQIEFHRYVEKLIDHLGQSQAAAARGIKLFCRADPVMLKLDQAMPCGLLINELVSNGLKHAFPGGRTGEIRVSIKEQSDRVTLAVADTGVGLDADWQSVGASSLGLKMSRALSSQIGGELACVSGPDGTEFSIEFRPTRETAREKAA